MYIVTWPNFFSGRRPPYDAVYQINRCCLLLSLVVQGTAYGVSWFHGCCISFRFHIDYSRQIPGVRRNQNCTIECSMSRTRLDGSVRVSQSQRIQQTSPQAVDAANLA